MGASVQDDDETILFLRISLLSILNIHKFNKIVTQSYLAIINYRLIARRNSNEEFRKCIKWPECTLCRQKAHKFQLRKIAKLFSFSRQRDL
jgi:hypothetical protein